MKLMQIEVTVFETDDPTIMYRSYGAPQGVSMAMMPIVSSADRLLSAMINTALSDLSHKLKEAAEESES